MSQARDSVPNVPDLGSFRLGEWSVNQAEGTLSANGRCVRLEPRVMDVLAYLASEQGRVVTKDQLLEAVWGGAFVEEGALSQAVHNLRKALGDDARQPRFIQTIPKRGYRLLTSVTAEADIEGLNPRFDPTPSPATFVKVPERPSRSLRRRLLLLLAGLGIAASVVVWLGRDRLLSSHRLPRIVVLPFENLGRPEDAFFADGLTEEITRDLYTLQSLRVISRTSAVVYGGANKSLPQIGKELNVDYVLEGTVRWATGLDGRPRVRITPQLIRVADDVHVWADVYEREIEHVFEVQEEISRRVIAELGITLLPQQKLPTRARPPENLDAYRAYIRGLQLKNQPYYSEDFLRKAILLLERATQLEPRFAAAWAELSQAHSHLAFNSDRSPARVEKARQALNRAIAINHDLPEVRIAEAYFTYRCLEDFGAAHQQLSAALQLYPNDAGVLETLGYVLRREGQLKEAIDVLEESAELNPVSSQAVWAVADTFRALRDYPQAEHYYRRAISLGPDEASFWEQMALNRLAWTGDVKQAREILSNAEMPENPVLKAAALQLDLYARDYRRALARQTPELLQALSPQDKGRLILLTTLARQRIGDLEGARKAAEANRIELTANYARFPKEPVFRAYLAVALAQLGQESEALRLAGEAVRLKQHDAFSGPRMLQIQAMAEAILGHRDAIDHLTRLRSKSYRFAISSAELRLDPIWDPLRNEAGFELLIGQN